MGLIQADECKKQLADSGNGLHFPLHGPGFSASVFGKSSIPHLFRILATNMNMNRTVFQVMGGPAAALAVLLAFGGIYVMTGWSDHRALPASNIAHDVLA
jgi:hypothetical protein